MLISLALPSRHIQTGRLFSRRILVSSCKFATHAEFQFQARGWPLSFLTVSLVQTFRGSHELIRIVQVATTAMVGFMPASKNVATNSDESKSNLMFFSGSRHFDGDFNPKVDDGVHRVSKVAHDSGIRDGSSLSNFFKREVNSKIVMDVHTSYQSSTSNSHRKRDGFFSQDS